MGLKERLESEKRVKNMIGFEYFKLESMDRAYFIRDLKEYIKEPLDAQELDDAIMEECHKHALCSIPLRCLFYNGKRCLARVS